jgi:hypothetical protein
VGPVLNRVFEVPALRRDGSEFPAEFSIAPVRLGELFLSESPDQVGPAEDCFRQAIDTARRQQSRAWELQATMSLARLWQRQGRRDEAHAALAAVYGTFTEGFTTPDLVDTAALIKDEG